MLANLKPARAKKNYFPGQEKTSGDGRVGTSTYLDLNLPQLKLGLHCRPNFNCGKAPPFWQKGGALDPLQCFLSIVYQGRKEPEKLHRVRVARQLKSTTTTLNEIKRTGRRIYCAQMIYLYIDLNSLDYIH